MGDFNRKVGDIKEDNIVGPFGLGQRNENWQSVQLQTHDQQLLVNICVTHDNILLDNSMAETADSEDDDDVAAAVICLIACKQKRRHAKTVWVQSWIRQR